MPKSISRASAQAQSSIQNSAAVLSSANHITPVGSIARALDAGVITVDRAGGDGMVVLSVAIYSQVKGGQRSAIQFSDQHDVAYAVRGQDFTDAQARANAVNERIAIPSVALVGVLVLIAMGPQIALLLTG